MPIDIRSGRSEDITVSGRILHEAFTAIATRHNFPSDFADADFGVSVAQLLLDHPKFYSVVAELNGTQIGINFLDERGSITGVGPIGIDPALQNSGAGRQLMMAVLERSENIGARGIRLLQDAFHTRSFALYTKLGFETRAGAAVMQGSPLGQQIQGRSVRTALHGDIPACADICEKTHGHDRTGELRDAVVSGAAKVVEDDQGISGYSTGVGLYGHSIGVTNEDLMALIADASEFSGPGFLVPSDNVEILTWCMENDLKVIKLMNLMTAGFYLEPRTPYMPSVLY